MAVSSPAIVSYILGFATGAVGWIAGMAASTFLQDREHIRRQRGALGVLLIELRRIRAQLGGTDSHWIDTGVLGQVAAIPGIHPWVVGCINDVAQADPSVLAEFMHLELLLGNQTLFVGRLREVRDETRTALAEPITTGQPQDPGSEYDAVAQRVLARLNAKLEQKERDRAVRDAVEFVDMNHRLIVKALAFLKATLVTLDGVLLREQAFSLRRLLGARVSLTRDRADQATASRALDTGSADA